jgi:hypothetical protein
MNRRRFFFVPALLVAVSGCGPRGDSGPSNPFADGDKPASPEEQLAIEEAAKVGGYKGHPHSTLAQPVLEFQFSDAGPTDSDLEKLRPALEAVSRGVGLNLNGCQQITDAGVAKLKDLANLKALSLGRTQATAKCLETVTDSCAANGADVV